LSAGYRCKSLARTSVAVIYGLYSFVYCVPTESPWPTARYADCMCTFTVTGDFMVDVVVGVLMWLAYRSCWPSSVKPPLALRLLSLTAFTSRLR